MKKQILLQKVESSIIYLSENGFPEINCSEIKISIVKDDSYFMASERFNLYVSIDCLKLNDVALNGVLVHELIHIVNYKKNPVLDFFRSLLYFIPQFETYFERRTDREVIRRGFGVQLLEFIKFHDQFYKKYNKSDGLTKKEIKKKLENENLLSSFK